MARNLDNMKPEELAAKVDALSPVWAKDYIRRLERLVRNLASQVGPGSPAQPEEPAEPSAQAPAEPSVWTPAGITPPNGDYATLRVLDGAADMTPLADLPDRAEIRFTDFYQVHYGAHESTGGMRVLVIEGDDKIVIHPISQYTVLISRGGQAR